MGNEDILKKMQDDLIKKQEILDEFYDESKKVINNKAVIESMASAFKQAEEIERILEEKAKAEADGQKRLEQYYKEHEPDINIYIIEFIHCELDIISSLEMTDFEKKALEDLDKKITDENKKINNNGGLSKLFSKKKDREIEEKIAQLSKEKQNKSETIKEIHIKKYKEIIKRRGEILEKISSHSKGFEGLSILSKLFEGYSEQLSENKNDLLGKIKEHNEKVKRDFPISLSVAESMINDSNAVSNLKEEKSNLTSQVQLLKKQSDEIESARNLILDKIIERPEEDIESESTIGYDTKKIVQQTLDEFAKPRSIEQYLNFREALKERKRNNGHTKKSEEDIKRQFEML